ncbi:MAG TPA: biotin/lipoyl-containing protein, partial [Pirellulales bacterium]
SPYYDPMLAKLIVHAPTREEAARRLAHALARARIHGLRTNRDLLVHVLSHPEFLASRTDTDFLTRHDLAKLAAPLADAAAEQLHAAAAVLFVQAQRRREAEVLPHVPSGWRNNPSQMQSVRLATPAAEINVEYQFGRGGLKIQINGEPLADASCELVDSNCIRLCVGGVERTYRVTHVENTFCVDSSLGASEFAELPRFPVPGQQLTAGSLIAPLPGIVHEVRVRPGDSVAAGDILLVLDSMKVFHRITAPHAGQVAEVRVAAGVQVDQGALLVVIDVSEVKTGGKSHG